MCKVFAPNVHQTRLGQELLTDCTDNGIVKYSNPSLIWTPGISGTCKNGDGNPNLGAGFPTE